MSGSLQDLELKLVLALTEGLLKLLLALGLSVDVLADGLQTLRDGASLAVLQEREGGELKLGLEGKEIQDGHCHFPELGFR